MFRFSTYDFCVWCQVRAQVPSLCSPFISNVPAPFDDKSILSLFIYLGIFIKKCVSLFLYFLFCSTDLYVYPCTNTTPFHYRSYTVSLENNQSSNIIFFLDSLPFYINLESASQFLCNYNKLSFLYIPKLLLRTFVRDQKA